MTNFWLPSSKDVKSLLKYLGKIIIFVGFPGGSDGKESACNAGDMGSIPGLGRSPEEGKGYPLQYSDLQNSIDCIVHEVTKSRTRLRDFNTASSLSAALKWSTLG